MKNSTIGLISDTHNLVRPEALKRLAGVSHIVHAGDICDADVLRQLQEIAPVTAVRGNNDRGNWAKDLPQRITVELGGLRIHVVHDLHDLRLDTEEDIDAVVFGHSHKPLVEARDGVLFVNPGSAGPRRFTLPISVALLQAGEDGPSARIELLG